jgi:hypothetical protein
MGYCRRLDEHQVNTNLELFAAMSLQHAADVTMRGRIHGRAAKRKSTKQSSTAPAHSRDSWPAQPRWNPTQTHMCGHKQSRPRCPFRATTRYGACCSRPRMFTNRNLSLRRAPAQQIMSVDRAGPNRIPIKNHHSDQSRQRRDYGAPIPPAAQRRCNRSWQCSR